MKRIFIKPNFWILQVAGWTLFFLISSYDSPNLIRLFSSVAIPFILTSLLRYPYKYIYAKKLNIYYVLVIISILSGICGIIYYVLRGIAYTTFFPGEFVDFNSYYMSYNRIMDIIWLVAYLSVIFFCWSFMYFGVKYYFNLQDEKDKSHNLVLLAQQAQLQMLRYQINPHFLFNTLNSIKALARRDSSLAEIMITELSEFLRYTLKHNDKTVILLEEEIEIVKKYLLLEKIRYENRLSYMFDIDDRSLKVNVLCFLLQPFVENAIKHGLKSSPKGVSIIIRSFIADSNLYIQVRNTGKWINSSEAGSGIKNVQNRLEVAYPGKHEFSINKTEEEVSVTISIKGVI